MEECGGEAAGAATAALIARSVRGGVMLGAVDEILFVSRSGVRC